MYTQSNTAVNFMDAGKVNLILHRAIITALSKCHAFTKHYWYPGRKKKSLKPV